MCGRYTGNDNEEFEFPSKEEILSISQEEIDELTNSSDEPYIPSKRHKIRMNRIFRENVGGKFLPFPEVDNIFERIRSKIVIMNEKLKAHG